MEIGLGVLAPKLYIAFPNIFCFLVVLREHNSAPKWSICAIKGCYGSYQNKSLILIRLSVNIFLNFI
jgi:hypothetical protein